MRKFFPFLVLPSLLLMSVTASYAQENGQDEFSGFRDKLNASKQINLDAPGQDPLANLDAPGGASPATMTPSPDEELTPEEYLANANNGDPAAMIELAVRYREGSDGLPKNDVQAMKWYQLAYQVLTNITDPSSSNAGLLEEARKWRASMRQSMSRAELDETTALVTAWRPSKGEGEASATGALLFDGMLMAESEITSVTVYSDRAVVTRRAAVNVPKGAQTVVFRNLPLGVNSENLRAEGKAEGVVMLGAVTLKPVSTRTPGTKPTQDIGGKLEELADKQLALDAQRSALGQKKDFLDKLIAQATALPADRSGKTPSLPIEQWSAVTARVYDEMASISKALLENSLRNRAIERERQALNAAPAKRERGRVIDSTAVLIPVNSEEATKLTLDLTYQVGNATWQPVYDARLDAKGKLELIQFANVRQKTGEDWRNVELTLSTARPQRLGGIPELSPRWLTAFETPDYSMGSAGNSAIAAGASLSNKVGKGVDDEVYRKAIEAENRRKAEEAMRSGWSVVPTPIGSSQTENLSIPPGQTVPSADPLAEWRQKAEARRLSVDAVVTPALINTGGFVSEYKIIAPARVLSDATDVKVLIGKFLADTEMQVQIVPQWSTEAFTIAQINLKGDSPLLPGKVNLFREDAYIGQTTVPLLRPGEAYGLSFGVDDQVSVKRDTVQNQSKEQGVIARDNVVERQFITTVQNLHPSPIKLVVKEAIPVSQTEKINIALQQSTTAGYKMDSENVRGVMSWNLDLQPKEKTEVKVGWSVTWPKDHTLNGL
ncbi:MAG TPA: mucoidy inhibitor MuiA family protein [Patescibacteria group bacterium]|nr:mucoidy inhibitor MuiA family protein [Patescibacteria group bacterium]